MAKKNTTKKASTKKTAATKRVTPTKMPNPEAAKPTKDKLVVFAFRLTEPERTAIHKTAGPRNATQFVRRVAVAFAHEDEAAFKAVLKDAREARN